MDYSLTMDKKQTGIRYEMKPKRRYALLFFLVFFTLQELKAQTLEYNHNRIACSADGNLQPDHHPEAKWNSADPDDWGASAAVLAIIARHGLQDKLVHFSYNNFIGAPPHTTVTNEMKISTRGGIERFNFDKTCFFDVSEDIDTARNHLVIELEKSTENDPLFFIHMGPSEFFYRAIKQAMDNGNADALEHVQIISHSGWNDNHKRRYAHHTMADAIALSGNRLKYKKIVDQNAGWKSDYSNWYWMRDHADQNVQWIYHRADHHPSKVFDISDCGLVFYLLEGDAYGNSAKFNTFIGEGI